MWKTLEEATNTKFPPCVKTLLIDAGYNTMASLTSFSEDSLKRTEEFLNSKKEYINKLHCCYSDYYKKLNVFEFLPGHKSILLSLPNIVKAYQSKSIEKKKTRPNNVPPLLSSEELRGKLIKLSIAYSRKAGQELADVITERNILDFQREGNQANVLCRCRFSCPFCPKIFSVIYKTFWMSSNVTKHLKKHIDNVF